MSGVPEWKIREIMLAKGQSPDPDTIRQIARDLQVDGHLHTTSGASPAVEAALHAELVKQGDTDILEMLDDGELSEIMEDLGIESEDMEELGADDRRRLMEAVRKRAAPSGSTLG